MMSFFRAVVFLCFCLFVFVGCWEEETLIYFDKDGSGEIEQKLVLSDRLMVASSQAITIRSLLERATIPEETSSKKRILNAVLHAGHALS